MSISAMIPKLNIQLGQDLPVDKLVEIDSEHLVVVCRENSSINVDALRVLDNDSTALVDLLKSKHQSDSAITDVYLPAWPQTKAQAITLVLVDEDQADLAKTCEELAQRIVKAKHKNCHIFCDADLSHSVVSSLVLGLEYGHYQYHKQTGFSEPTSTDDNSLEQVVISASADTSAYASVVTQAQGLGFGVNVSRRLGDLPGNLLGPEELALSVRDLCTNYPDIEVVIHGEKKLQEEEMYSFLSVGAGSDRPCQLIEIHYKPKGTENDAPSILVGKAITFDTGGISLKPSGGMGDMKYDMCGSASVVGTMAALAETGVQKHVIGLLAAAENMPSGGATRPGDIVRAKNGKTIEILNTDAEGRLVLCDTLTYAEKYQPAEMIDIATLTGACVVALGHHRSAVYSKSDELAQALVQAGETCGDEAWHMPMGKKYDKQLESKFADLSNIGGPSAGSITAACFLGQFTTINQWAHLDIAGTAMPSGKNKGATGRPTRLLYTYLTS